MYFDLTFSSHSHLANSHQVRQFAGVGHVLYLEREEGEEKEEEEEPQQQEQQQQSP